MNEKCPICGVELLIDNQCPSCGFYCMNENDVEEQKETDILLIKIANAILTPGEVIFERKEIERIRELKRLSEQSLLKMINFQSFIKENGGL